MLLATTNSSIKAYDKTYTYKDIINTRLYDMKA